MKYYVPFLIMIVVLGISSSANGDAQENISNIVIPQISYEQYRVIRILGFNKNQECPSLDYWGIKGAEWGMERKMFLDSTSPFAHGAKTREKSPTIINNNSVFSGIPCRSEVFFDGASSKQRSGAEKIKSVKRYFAAGVEDREQRLAVYQQIKAVLMAHYNAPTHNIHADEIFRGKDAYVQGLDDQYHVEWHGPETIVSLQLSDDELVLEYRQAPTSKADVYRERVTQAHEFKALQAEKLKALSEMN
jgi:hypothetical protein